MKKRIGIFGSTGSIGETALGVVNVAPEEFQVVVLSATGKRLERLKQQCKIFKPKYLLLELQSAIKEMIDEFPDIIVMNTLNGHDFIANKEKLDVAIIATVGLAGLKPTFAMAKCSKIIAIANKESIVYGGQIMLDHLMLHNSKLIPVDSEHNSLYQLLKKTDISEVKKLIITASGGSLRDFTGDLTNVTVEQALAHPKWQMGNKCTIDAANLVNKGIELIEASILFNTPPSQIEAVIHPQVIIHAMLQMKDNSIFSFMSNPNMALHLANAMRDNNKEINVVEPIDLIKLGVLEFREIDKNRFPGVRIAREAIEAGRSYTVAFNSADEILVEAFVNGQIKFTQITELLEKVLNKITNQNLNNIDDIVAYDAEIKSITQGII